MEPMWEKYKASNRQVLYASALFLLFVINLFLILPLLGNTHWHLSNVLQNRVQATSLSHDPPPFKSDIRPIYEWKLVDRTQKGDYVVETYREYRWRYNEKGEPLQATPTDRYHYLRYWQP